VYFKNTITKEFLPGHSYSIWGSVNDKGHRTVSFSDATKISGSEKFVEDDDGN
jgi:hypothetical protein